MALMRLYISAVADDAQGEFLYTWEGFVLVWLPGSILIGAGITFGWPRLLDALRRRRDRS